MPFHWQEPPNSCLLHTKHTGYGMWQYENFKVIDYDGRDPQSVKKTFYDKKPDVGS